ncbi:hypothetical protein SAMN05421505_10652 [Sinosporangium album]|uniref:4-amino-4-deoxy-L-arabinose transferase n=1 Tax=Sinosporangium album TaxID=504805 RepID=A0A1G7VUS9_9ACTN|nr:hypothetical protein [Sinosporangium album]SDG63331.1 hypothetical protein SAMN05421505_10652 [Sinosporangium album]
MRALPNGWRGAWPAFWPYAVGALLGVLALAPALAPGFTLAYDMVFVPEPVLLPSTFGMTGTLPRAVPSDAVVALLGAVLPGALVQKLILLAVFVLACAGPARLLDGRPVAVRLAAGVFYAWNPFVAERLLLGQWALLLGYAGLPWAVRAALAAGERFGWGWAVAFVPAAVGGFMAMIITALTVLPVAALGPGRRLRGLCRTGVVWVVFSLPWLVPSLLRQGEVPSDPVGVEAFAARADTPLGGLGSLFTLSGVWNAEVVPPGLDLLVPSVLRLVFAVAAVVAFAAARDMPAKAGLAVAAAVGLAVAAVGLGETGRAALAGLIDVWPGFAVLRDAQQYVAPLALLTALGAGALAALLGRPGAVSAVAPLLLLPGLAFGAWGRLAAVDYPGDFERIRALVAADRTPGDVLLLPWESYRAYDWNGRRSSLDPLPRFLPRHVVWNDAVRVGDLVIGMEDPRAKALDPLIRSSRSLAEPLREAGFRFVVLDGDRREWNGFQSRLAGAVQVHSGPHAALYALNVPDGQVSGSP